MAETNSKETDSARFFEDVDLLNQALKTSRQYMILLEDYRYLLSCFQDTCNCHANFDHQFFLKKLEQRYDFLAKMVTSNKTLDTILNTDDCDNQLDLELVDRCGESASNKKLFISRIKLGNRSDDIASVQRELEEVAREELGDIPKYDVSLNGTKVAYKCSSLKCDFLSFDQDEMIEHFRSHGNETKGISNQDQSSSDEKKDAVLYVCDQCGKEFTGQKWLENHIENVHSSNKLYSCEYPGCHYKSKFRCVLIDHEKRHRKSKDFKCSFDGQCQAQFVTRRDLMAHINFHHKQIRNYFCDWPSCNASFKDSNRLKHHRYTHTGERPYRCDYPGCLSSFKQAPHLIKHKRVHIVAGKLVETESSESASETSKLYSKQTLLNY